MAQEKEGKKTNPMKHKTIVFNMDDEYQASLLRYVDSRATNFSYYIKTLIQRDMEVNQGGEAVPPSASLGHKGYRKKNGLVQEEPDKLPEEKNVPPNPYGYGEILPQHVYQQMPMEGRYGQPPYPYGGYMPYHPMPYQPMAPMGYGQGMQQPPQAPAGYGNYYGYPVENNGGKE